MHLGTRGLRNELLNLEQERAQLDSQVQQRRNELLNLDVQVSQRRSTMRDVWQRQCELDERDARVTEREQMVTSREETLQTLMDEAHEARKEYMRAVDECEKAAQQATVDGADPVKFAQFVLQECARDQERESRTNGARFLRSIRDSGEYLQQIVKRVLQKMFVPKTPAVRRRVVVEPQGQEAQDDGLSL
jgi:chromosome segregation ATPase